MAIPNSSESTVHAAKGSANKDARMLDKLSKLWADHNTRSLEVRLETGKLLNARLGEPTQRQRRGQSVLRQAAETLHIAVSEFNRMRWFAHFSKDEQSCWGEVPPGIRSWTKFKELLPRLIAAVKGTEERQRSLGDKRKSVSVDALLRSIKSATSKLGADDFAVEGPKKEELIGSLQDLVSAISNRLGIHLHVEVNEEEDGMRDHGRNTAVVGTGCESSHTCLSPCLSDTAAA